MNIWYAYIPSPNIYMLMRYNTRMMYTLPPAYFYDNNIHYRNDVYTLSIAIYMLIMLSTFMINRAHPRLYFKEQTPSDQRQNVF